MSKKTYTELICDTCGSAEQFFGVIPLYALIDYDWIYFKKQHFCSIDCKENYYKPVETWKDKD